MGKRSAVAFVVATLVAASGCAPTSSEGLEAGEVGSTEAPLCWFWCSSYTETKYPIVLAHGFLGFDELLGGVIEYWNGIPDALADGGAEVYVVTTAVVNSSVVRGELIIDQLEDLSAITGHAKFNLIGHSQGGLDIRYVAAVRPDLVASVTTVASPHQGTGIGDLASSDGLAQLGETALTLLAELLILLGAPDGPIDFDATFEVFSTEGIAAFNAAYPAALPSGCGEGAKVVNGIRYYSWSGTGVLTNVLDPLDALFGITSLFVGEANDGLVGRCSSHLGDVIRDNYFQNHLDEVNLFFGLVSPFTSNPKTLFRNHANRLKRKGL
ncbi:MAG: triacylglycerol lipase [Myxococcota bacterium]